MIWSLRVITSYTIFSIIIVLFFAIFFVPMILRIVSRDFSYKIAKILSYCFVYILWCICGIKFKIEGAEKLPQNKKDYKGQPYLLLSNHQSFWENFFMQLIVPKHSWVIKRELLTIPVFGWGLGALDTIAVNRDNKLSVMQILKEGVKKFKQNYSMVMFPEATRIHVNKEVKFKPSAAKLAINGKVPIVLMVHNAGLFWPKGFWFKKPGTITVKILQEITVDEVQNYNPRDLTVYIEKIINSEKKKLI